MTRSVSKVTLFFALGMSHLLLMGSQSVSQLFVVPICPELSDEHIDAVRNLLKTREIGGIIFMQGCAERQRQLTREFKQLPRPPILFQDAEWGVGMRLKDCPALPRNMTLAATGDLQLLYLYGRQLAYQCRALGIDVNLAPVCDVNTHLDDPVIGIRSLGNEPEKVGAMARVIYRGMRSGGLAGCAKHFPGHGETDVDSHVELPTLCSLEMAPFEALVDEGIELVMIGHLLYSPVSSMPSSLSPAIIQGLLRKEMGFEGVVISDALNMGALREYGCLGQVCEKALVAGNDLVLFASADCEELNWLIREGIPNAIAYLEGRLPQEMIRQKRARIGRLGRQAEVPIPEEISALSRQIYRKAITAIGTIPQMGDVVTLVRRGGDTVFEQALCRYAEVVVTAPEDIDPTTPYLIVEQGAGESFRHLPDHAVVCLFDLPKTLSHPRALIGYESHPDVKEAVADCLFGRLIPFGKLPIQVCEGLGGEDVRPRAAREGQVRCDLEGLPQLPRVQPR